MTDQAENLTQSIDLNKQRELEGGRYINELNAVYIKNAESFDKAILSLSTGSLGLSVLFLDKVISYSNASYMTLLIISWFGFGISIISNIISLFIAQWETTRLKNYAEKFYYEKIDSFGYDLRRFKSKSILLNYISGFSYVLAITLTLFFTSLNLSQRSFKMSDQEKVNKPSTQHEHVEFSEGTGARVRTIHHDAQESTGAIPPQSPSDTSTINFSSTKLNKSEK